MFAKSPFPLNQWNAINPSGIGADNIPDNSTGLSSPGGAEHWEYRNPGTQTPEMVLRTPSQGVKD